MGPWACRQGRAGYEQKALGVSRARGWIELVVVIALVAGVAALMSHQWNPRRSQVVIRPRTRWSLAGLQPGMTRQECAARLGKPSSCNLIALAGNHDPARRLLLGLGVDEMVCWDLGSHEVMAYFSGDRVCALEGLDLYAMKSISSGTSRQPAHAVPSIAFGTPRGQVEAVLGSPARVDPERGMLQSGEYRVGSRQILLVTYIDEFDGRRGQVAWRFRMGPPDVLRLIAEHTSIDMAPMYGIHPNPDDFGR